MRALVASLFLVLAITGPYLCCCSPMIVAAALSTQAAVNSIQDYDCPLCAQSKPKPVDESPRPPCRCPHYETPEMLPVENKSIVHKISVARDVGAMAFIIVFDFNHDSKSAGESRLAMGPFLSTSMRLYQHHALRC
jgi:hypothetical protein